MPLKNLLYIGNKLSGKGANVTTIETLGTLFTQEGYSVFYASDKRNPLLRLADMIFSVFRYHKRVDFVLIDTYSTSAFWYAFAVSQLCRILNKKYIPILHGGNLPSRLKKNPKRCRMVFGNAFQNVAPSHYLYQGFRAAEFDNLVFIPNVIEIQKYAFKERNESRPKLLWVRAFAAIYNPKMAVDVLLQLQQHYPEAELCMVGPEKDGSMAETREYAERLGVSIQFTGRLPKEEWLALSSEYDIFINTTHFDNTPVSVMEAMALGLPVVSTNVGGMSFLLKDKEDGLLVNDGDVEGMVEAIVHLIEDVTFSHSLSVTARKKAESWDWEMVKEQWKALLG